MVSPVLLILGLAVLGFGLFTFHQALVRKLGLVSFMAATFILFHWMSGSLLIGAAGIALWFALPWIELLTRVRRMDLPRDKALRRRIPPKDDFPFLAEATSEIEATGRFDLIDDWGYDWQGTEHFFRLFYDKDRRIQAAVCMIRDETMFHAYVKLVSRDEGDTIYTTWNYPFSASLKLSPEHRLQWDRASESFEAMLETHLRFVERELPESHAIAEQEVSQFQESLREDQRRLVDHNLHLGVLRTSGEGRCRYTWRGLLFLWTQLVKDFVRLH